MSNYEFEILHEEASDTDSFSDQTHSKAADNICRIMDASSSAVTIGLEGSWGSGKSTVVNLISQKVDNAGKKTLIFIFDAWAHDGDPLRRIFLESLIDQIDPKGIDEFLSNLKGEISGRRKSVKVITKKSASSLGGILSVAAILVPLGAALMSAIDFDAISGFSTDAKPYWPLWIGLLFATLPVFALLGWRWFSSNISEEPRSGIKRFFLGSKDWSVFESASQESYSQDVTEDSERTSIEFERFFAKIMQHAIGQSNKYQRALIVIDNLDRIEPEHTLSIWSILQTFFQYRSHRKSKDGEWRSNLWFLIPYDREALSKVWSKNDINNLSQKSDTIDNLTNLEPGRPFNAGNRTADSFFEKCFQLIEEVPEPVLTSWVEYCKNKIEESLIGWPAEEREIVFETFCRYKSSLVQSPTPRQIQAFINKVGLLGMRWGTSMSSEAIALYALARRNRSERQLRLALLSSRLPDNFQAWDEAGLKEELAGMLFGVDKSKGIQLLLEPEIGSALRDGDSDRIRKLIAEQGEAFWVVWNSMRGSSLPSGHTEEYRIAVTKAFCNGVQESVQRASLDINRIAEEWKFKDQKWEIDKHCYSEALSALISVSDDIKQNLLEWLNRKVKTELKSIISSVGTENFKSGILEEARALLDLLSLHSNPIQKLRYPALEHKNWIAWLDELERSNLKFPEVLPNVNTVSKMVEAIDAQNAGGSIPGQILLTLEVDGNKSYWMPIAEKLIAWAIYPSHALGLDDAYCLLAKCYVLGGKEVKSKFGAMLANAEFFQRASQESIENVPALTSLFAVAYKNETLKKPVPPNFINFFKAKSAGERIKKVVDRLRHLNSLGVVWELARDPENIFSIDVIQNSEYESRYSADGGAYYIDEYSWATEADLQRITNRLISSGSFEKAKEVYINEPSAYVGCLKKISGYGGAAGKKIIDDVLPKIASKSWIESFDDESDLYQLLGEKGNHEFKEAVKSFCAQEIEKNSITASFWASFPKIYEKLPDKNDVVTIVIGKYFDCNVDPFKDDVFDGISGCIKSENLSNVPAKLIMERVELWVSTDQWGRLEWLLSLEFPVTEMPSESLVSRLKASTSVEVHRDINAKIASIYGIELTPPDEESLE